jgi:hypothetical protein
MSEDRFPGWARVLVIYDADVLSARPSFIEEMSPAAHIDGQHAGVAAAFTQTEGDEQYDFGYLAAEGASSRYLPYEPDFDEEERGEGQHRKWVGELSREDWRIFADAYQIDLDPATDLPLRYEETMGSITQYGHLEAISVDNREGWNDFAGEVISSSMYLSFATEGDPAS